MESILEIEDLKMHIFVEEGVVKAVDGISLTLNRGEVLGLVGESGSGKSMTLRSIMRLIPPAGKYLGGKILYRGENLLTSSQARMEDLRGGEIALILQEPMTALNPVLTIGEQLKETIIEHTDLSGDAVRDRSLELLDLVGIPGGKARLKEYPHQFSGGMQQRAMIAISLACNPQVLLADEPTTALDVTIQDQILQLVNDLQEKMDMSVIWVTHDLGVVAQLCDRVAVMYGGHIMEYADVVDLYEESRHPYTEGLLQSIPTGVASDWALTPVPGQPPNLLNIGDGCPFEPRCRYAKEACKTAEIPLREVSPSHRTACIRYEEIWK
jgi:oligopeptide/dipeptide ABC transporter ATP-binding protein